MQPNFYLIYNALVTQAAAKGSRSDVLLHSLLYKNESGYTGQLLEWPEVISEGAAIEDCRLMLEDAAREMIEVYREDGRPIPQGHSLFESITIDSPILNKDQKYVGQ